MYNKKLKYSLLFLAHLLAFSFTGTVFADEDYIYRASTEVSAGVLNGTNNSKSGAYEYSYPIYFPEGRNGIQPSFKLQYNNQDIDQANIAGYGWLISIPYINRLSKKGVDKLYPDDISGSWNPNDYYFSSSLSGEILPVDPTTTTSRIYGAKVETGDFLNYEFTDNSWIVTDKLGTTYTFGATTTTRQDDSTDTDNVYKWMLEEVRDTNDNYITYSYYKDSGMVYPSSTIYTGHGSTDGIYEVIFSREARNDTPILYNTGFSVQPNYRISEIQVKVNGTWVRKYELDYTTGDNGKRSLLQTITESGNDNGATLTLPLTTFTYQTKTQGFASSSSWGPEWEHLLGNPPTDPCTAGTLADKRILDYNGDGLVDMFSSGPANYCSSGSETEINNGDESFTLNTGIGLPELVLTGNLTDNGVRFDDLNGDSYVDVVQANVWVPSSGPDEEYSDVYLNDRDGTGWTASTTFDLPYQFIKHFENYSTRAQDVFTRLADVNGDGFADILKESTTSSDRWVYLNNTIGGFADYDSDYTVPKDLGSYEAQSKETVIMDVNGDGLNDFVSSGPELYYSEVVGNQKYPVVSVCLNMDGGKNYDCGNMELDTPEAPSIYTTEYYDNASKFMDVNGDGLVDFVRSDPGGDALFNGIFINKGDGTGWAYDPTQTVPVDFVINGDDDNAIRAADLNGDGLADFFDVDGGGNVWLNNGKNPDVLVSIDDSKGVSTDVDYKTAQLYRDSTDNNQANPDLPLVVHTAENIITNDGFGNIATTTYQYGLGEYYFNTAFDKRFAGFGITTTTDAIGNSIVQYFHQGNETNAGFLERSDSGSKINMMYREDVLDDSGNLYKQTLNKYDNTDLGNNRNFVYLSETLVRDFDGDADAKNSAQSFSYNNSNGNLIQQTNWGEVSVTSTPDFGDTGTDKLIDNYAYATDGDVLVGLLSRQTTLDSSSSTIKEVKNYYDSLSFGSVSDGNKTKTESWVTSTTYIDTQFTYNSYGLVTTSTDANNNQTEFEYDTHNLFVTTSTNALSQETSYVYDYTFGKPTRVTDPNNQVYETLYDQIGRVIGERIPDIDGSPGDTVSSTDRIYTDNTVPRIIHTKSYLNSVTTTDTYTYLNGFGKKVQERVEAETGYSVKDFKYNKFGLLSSESLPYFGTGLPSVTTASTTYDHTNKAVVISEDVGGYMSITDSEQSGLDLSSDFTLEMWINPTSTPPSGSSYSIIQKDEGAEHSYHLYYYVSGGNPYVYLVVTAPGSEVSRYVDYTIPINQWTHIAVATDLTAGNFGLYANGSFVASSTSGFPSSVYNGTAPFNVFYNDGVPGVYDGMIDDLRVWSDIRTSSEISNNYQDELIGDETNLVSYWHFNDNLDDITSGNNLSWINGAGQLSTNTPSLTMATTTGGFIPYAFDSTDVSQTTDSDLYTNYVYDALKRVKIIGNVIATTTNAYNQWTVSTTDGLSNTKLYHNDAFGQLTRVTEYNNTETYDTYYEYNGNGKLTKITDALDNVRNFEYDGLGRRTNAEDLHAPADSYFGTWAYSYDNNGNLTSSTDPNIQTVNYTYDELNRQETENYTGEVGTEITYLYDGCTNGVGRLCSVVMDSASTTLSYDALGNIATELKTVSSTDYQTSFEYDRQGNTTLITYPDNSVVKYLYNSAGQLETVSKKESGEGSFSSVVDNFNYSPLGQINTQENANGTVTTNTYNADALYRLTSKFTEQTDSLSDPGDNRLNVSVLQDIYYGYDAVGNITQTVDVSDLDTNKAVAYLYDDLYRLLTASTAMATSTSPGGYTRTYTYNAIGDILSKYADGNSIATSTQSTISSNTNSIDIEKDSSQYLSIIGANQTGLAITGDFTIETWVSSESVLSTWAERRLIYRGSNDNTSAYNLELYNNNGTLQIYGYYADAGYRYFDANYTWSEDTWFHVAVTCDVSASTCVVYVNGSALTTTMSGSAITSVGGGSYPLHIGVDGGGTGSYYDGKLDEIRIWDDLRTAQEIADNYDTELVGTEANLVGYWKLNDDLLDETSNNNDLTNNNSAVFSTGVPFAGTTTSTITTSTVYYIYTEESATSTGSNTNSVDLEKDSSQYLSITNANQTGLGVTGTLTMEAWVKTEHDFANFEEQWLVSKYDGSNGYGMELYNDNGTLKIIGSNRNSASGGDRPFSANYTWTTGQWFHIAAVFDGIQTWIVYVNGSPLTTSHSGSGSGIGTNTNPFYVGINFSLSAFLDGLLDDVRVWNDARTAQEIEDNFETELVGDEANLVSYWKFNNDGTDENTNGNDLTNNNSAVFVTDVPFVGVTSSTVAASTTYYLYQGDTGTLYANPHALTLTSTTASTTAYTYDNNGNVTSYGDWSNIWDYMNRLLQSVNSVSLTTTTYEYDQSGQRVYKNVDGVESIYPNRYYTIEDGVVKKHVFAGGTEIASVQGVTTTYHHTDHLSGSSVETDHEGYVVEVIDYYPFGSTRIDEKYTDYENDRKFSGHFFDNSTDLYYMNARYQDPEIGRFISLDPVFLSVGSESELKNTTGLSQQNYLKNPQSHNSYAYSNNNPLVYRDPTGEFAFLIPIAAYAVAYAPVWVPAAVTGIAAIGAGVTAYFTGESIYHLSQGNSQAALQSSENAITTLFAAETALGGVMAVDAVASRVGPTVEKQNLRGTNNSKVQESALKGIRAHQQQQYPAGYEKEVVLPSGKRMDAYNPSTKHVIELKPDNQRAIKRGQQQVQQYCNECDRSFGNGHTGSVQTYNPADVN